MTCSPSVNLCLTRGIAWTRTVSLEGPRTLLDERVVQLTFRTAEELGATVLLALAGSVSPPRWLSGNIYAHDVLFAVTAEQTAELPPGGPLYFVVDIIGSGQGPTRAVQGRVDVHE